MAVFGNAKTWEKENEQPNPSNKEVAYETKADGTKGTNENVKKNNKNNNKLGPVTIDCSRR